jgi:hypothetical protein
MSKDGTLFVGLEVGSGEEVEVPIFHTLTTGQTQLSGKTTVQRKFAELLADKGFKVIIFDTKENLEDYSGIGNEIPVCLRQTTDSLVLLPLLEAVFKRRLPTGYYSVLSEVSSGTKNYEEVIKRARDLEESTRSGWKKGACRTLYDLLERLEDQLQRVETVSTLELPYSINRMVLNYFPRASQQLFLRNAFEDILRIHNKRSIPMLDEAYKFLPQRWGSACAQPIQDVITQTAITGTYCYLATQFLAPTNKDPLKACAVRLLGTQDHKTEAKHTLDLIPFKGVATEDDIMKLPIGHFYVVTKKWAKLTYFLPSGVERGAGIVVATGKKTSEWVRDTYLQPTMEKATTHIREEPTRKSKPQTELKHLQEELKGLGQTVHHLQKTTKEDFIQVRNDFFGKISSVNQRLGGLEKRVADIKFDPEEIVSLVLQKIPMQNVHSEEIVKMVLERIPKSARSVVYTVAPLEKLHKDFQEMAKNQVLSDIASLDEESAKMLQFIESIQRGTTITEIMEKCLFISPKSGSRSRIQKKIATMESVGVIRRDKGANIYANLKDRIAELMEVHNATQEEIEAVYNHIISEKLLEG